MDYKSFAQKNLNKVDLFPLLITTGSFGAGFLPGLIVVAAIVAVIVYLINKTNKSLASEYALKK